MASFALPKKNGCIYVESNVVSSAFSIAPTWKLQKQSAAAYSRQQAPGHRLRFTRLRIVALSRREHCSFRGSVECENTRQPNSATTPRHLRNVQIMKQKMKRLCKNEDPTRSSFQPPSPARWRSGSMVMRRTRSFPPLQALLAWCFALRRTSIGRSECPKVNNTVCASREAFHQSAGVKHASAAASSRSKNRSTSTQPGQLRCSLRGTAAPDTTRL
jgi:hypothetical protein